MKIRSIEKVKNLSGRTVFLRVDFNVPLEKGRVREDYKIQAGLETIEFLAARGARLVIATHLGEPQKPDSSYSTRPVAARLKALLKRPVRFLGTVSIEKTRAAISKLEPGGIIMLENLRFNPGEYNNDPVFAKSLASLADIYVNDAFAVCHRAQASVAAIKKYLPAYAGLLLAKEVRALYKVAKPKKPLVIVMGGAKIGTKAPLIAKLLPAASNILIGGALANNFFQFQGWEIGRSLADKDSAAVIKKFFAGRKLNTKIKLPLDVVVRDQKGKAKVVLPPDIKKTDTILDIGPKTIAAYAAAIRSAKTLVWNGPMGKYEEKAFKHGTLAIASLIAARSSGRAYGLVGGGETIEALKLSQMAEYVDWVSTAGGAMLTYLGGGAMPGLKGIIS